MITIIAEKPSVAREIAKVINANKRNDGYLSNNETCVTWAFGHLVQLAMPDDYGYESYKAEKLPFLPETFKLIRRQNKTPDGYKPDEGAVKQLEIIQRLFNQSDKIIVATDAGREGELIFRYIYRYLNCHTPFWRLWVNSLTDKAILEGLDKLREGSEFDNLYYAARARSEADWLIGINASQALSVAAKKGTFSLGRVQTPVLAMICQRYRENKNFKSSPFWQIKVTAEKYNVTFFCLSAKYADKESAEENLKKINDSKQILVVGNEVKEVTQAPPLLYDLTTLQKDANIQFDLPAEKTLQIAQKLYENKLISYPRTGSRYLPQDVFEELPKLIDNLQQYPPFREYARSLDKSKLNRKPVNNSKVTDHHALIITETHIPPIMEEPETRIYNLIAGRMLESISGNCVKEVTNIKLDCAGIEFMVQGHAIKSKGWRAVFNHPETDEKEENNSILPVLEVNEKLPLKEAVVIQKMTKPKPFFTEATLLGAMETAGKELANEEERLAMKDSGLGTPATRAAVIEILFQRDYIRKEKKAIVPTDKGLSVIDIVGNMKIADVQLTGEWENVLTKIEEGKSSPEEFRSGIIELTDKITQELLTANMVIQDNSPECQCPRCKTAKLLFRNKVIKCSDPECDFLVFKNKGEKTISDKQIIELIEKGKTPLIKGFKNKNGQSFDAFLVFNDQFKLQYCFPVKKNKKRNG